MADKKGKFIVKQKTSFAAIMAGDITELGESDLCFQNENDIVQFEYVKPEEDKKYQVEPGTFILTETSGGLELRKFEMKRRELLESITNTAAIMHEANTFFKKLHVYEKLNRPKKRGVLLYSNPGMGKTSAIEKVSLDLIDIDPGTVVIVWPTSEIDADSIVRFLSYRSEYTKECTRLILVIEDIGGGEKEGTPSRSAVDSGLLNLLDGVGAVFKLPTFIIATTNHPENLLASLADRPGRFDLMLKLQAPSHDEKILLLGFIAKRALTHDEKIALGDKKVADFSIAHLEEVAVRAELHDKTYVEVIKELIAHKERFEKDFEDKNRSLGISGFRD